TGTRTGRTAGSPGVVPAPATPGSAVATRPVAAQIPTPLKSGAKGPAGWLNPSPSSTGGPLAMTGSIPGARNAGALATQPERTRRRKTALPMAGIGRTGTAGNSARPCSITTGGRVPAAGPAMT